MQVILNKREKEELVVKLHQEDKTIRQIAEIVHMSFKDIGALSEEWMVWLTMIIMILP